MRATFAQCGTAINIDGRISSIVSVSEVRPEPTLAKSFGFAPKNDFDALIDHLVELDLRRRAQERTGKTFRKAHSAPAPRVAKKPRPMPVIFRRPSPAPAETVAKAINMLNYDAGLTASQRGEILLGLSSLTDRVFAKADCNADGGRRQEPDGAA